MSVIKEENNRFNVYAKEPPMKLVDHDYRPMVAWDFLGECINGRFAMIGLFLGAVSYATTGNLFFGIF